MTCLHCRKSFPYAGYFFCYDCMRASGIASFFGFTGESQSITDTNNWWHLPQKFVDVEADRKDADFLRQLGIKP